MSQEEFLSFLSELVKINDREAKKRFAMNFLDAMSAKYGGQFELNGVLDELVDLLSRLEVGKGVDLQDGGPKDGD